MRALGVVVLDPVGDQGAGVIEAVEQGFVQELVAHAPVEALDEAVLHRFARRDVMPVDFVFRAPGEDGVRGQLGAVIGDDHARLAAVGDDRRQLAGHAPARDRGIGEWRRDIRG